ncbi:MAG: DUF3786 domain-containing protein [Deltaproteobacteria bacterium]|nr:DUF3786 domain-containing protein [Deltaproteobacteria bacterium]
MPISVLDVFKILPQTNCGDCGQSTCLAFATRVIKEGESLENCPHLPAAKAGAAAHIRAQQEQGVGRRRESISIALEAVQEKVAPLDFAVLAPGLGATYGQENGQGFLEFPFFRLPLRVFKNRVQYSPGVQANPWDAIFLYNYIASQGSKPLSGKWITYQSLPNSVSKVKTLERLQREFAAHISGRLSQFRKRAAALQAEPAAMGEDADYAAIFRPLPKVPVALLFWEAESEENFPAQVRFLFDDTVSDYLDLESLLFLVEGLIDRLQD